MKFVEFKTRQVRTFQDPDNDKGTKRVLALVDVKDIPRGINTNTNPRNQKLSTKVAQIIRDGLLKENDFLYKNRGIVISAENVFHDNNTHVMKVLLSDDTIHGIIDGGHTYRIICEHKDEVLDHDEQYVMITILTKVDKDRYIDISDGLNTSVQVKEYSIAEQKGQFDIVKMAISNTPFFKNVSFKQFGYEPISVERVIKILTLFNIDKYDGSKHPTVAYYGTAQSMRGYLDDYERYGNGKNNPFVKMRLIAPTFFDLYNYIEQNLPSIYNTVSNGHYGKLKHVGGEKELEFLPGTVVKNSTPPAYIYPIMAAFRVLLGEENGEYVWNADPKKYFDRLASKMLNTILDLGREQYAQNINAMGKSKVLWENLYNLVKADYYERLANAKQ